MSDDPYFVDAWGDAGPARAAPAQPAPRPGPSALPTAPPLPDRADDRPARQTFSGRASWVGVAVFGGAGALLVAFGIIMRVGAIVMLGLVLIATTVDSRSSRRRRHPGTVEEMLVGPVTPVTSMRRARLSLPNWTLPTPRRNARGRGVEQSLPPPAPRPRDAGPIPLELPVTEPRGHGDGAR